MIFDKQFHALIGKNFALFEIFGIKSFEFVQNESAVLSYQYVVEINLTAAVLGSLDKHEIPVNR